MSPSLLLPECADEVLHGERAGRRDLHAARDGFAPPDRMLHTLLDLLAADGFHVTPSARLRGWCRAIQKDVEARP
jgi:hypothetical protein